MGDGQLHLVDLWGIGLAVVLFAVFLVWHDLLEDVIRIARAFRNRYFTSSNTTAEAPETLIVIPAFAATNRTNEPNEPNEPALQSQTVERTGAFVVNADEIPAIARMIEHKTTAEKPTKASVIWAGFAVRKGDSTKYKRASLIYDTLFIIPDPPPQYREIEVTPSPGTLRRSDNGW